MPDVLANGIRVHYERRGVGTPMIWAHGLFSNSHGWEETISFFLRSYSVLSYDARGHGNSEVPENQAAYSQDIMVEDLRGLMDSLDIEQVVVGGHSMGANVALNFAILYPERCIACIPIGAGAGSADSHWRGEVMGSVADVAEREGMESVVELAKVLPGWELLANNPQLWERVRQDILACSPKGIANTIRGVQMKRKTVQEIEGQLHKLRVKTLVIVGDLDTPCLGASRLIAKFIPMSTLEVIRGTDHFTHIEAPQKFLNVVDHFLINSNG